jgi:hypothetical protein
VSEATLLGRARGWPRERLAARVSAASYGTILVLTSLAAIEPDAVESGWGWELVTAVGLATWVAHLYSEIVGDHLLDEEAHGGGSEVTRAATDGAPILLAAVLPAVMLLLGRVDVLAARVALWLAVAVALGQLVGLGAFVGSAVTERRSRAGRYAVATGAYGLAVVTLKVALGH